MNTTLTREPRISRLQVADAMHAGVLTCDRDAPLTDVAATMARTPFSVEVISGVRADVPDISETM